LGMLLIKNGKFFLCEKTYQKKIWFFFGGGWGGGGGEEGQIR